MPCISYENTYYKMQMDIWEEEGEIWFFLDAVVLPERLTRVIDSLEKVEERFLRGLRDNTRKVYCHGVQYVVNKEGLDILTSMRETPDIIAPFCHAAILKHRKGELNVNQNCN